MRWKWVVAAAALLLTALIVSVHILVSGYDFNRLKPQITRAALESTGRRLTIDGTIGIDIGFSPLLLVENVGFQNAPWGSRPEMVRIRRVEVQVALIPLVLGRIEVRRLIFVEPDILVETDSSGRSNLEFKPAAAETAPESAGKKPPAQSTLPALFFKDLRIRNGKLIYKDATQRQPFTLQINTLQAKSDAASSPINFTMNGACNSSAFAVSGVIGALPDLIDPRKHWPLRLTATAGNTALTLDGTVADPLRRRGIRLNVILQGKEPGARQIFLGKQLPFGGPFAISGRLSDPASERYKISDLKAAFGSSEIDGSLEIGLSSKPPKLTAALASKQLDLRPFLEPDPEQQPAGTKQPAPRRDRVFSDAPLPVQALSTIDADAEIRVARLIAPRLVLEDFAADIRLRGGHLEVAPFKAVMGGGMLDGRFNLESKQKPMVLTTKLTVDQMDLARMLKSLDITDALAGKLDANFELRSRGASVASLMAGLNGNSRMTMNNGRINNAYIDLLGGDMASGLIGLISASDQETDYTQIRCFVSIFDIHDGVAESNALVLSTERVNVIGEGNVDLKTEKLDFSLLPVSREGIGGVSMSLGNLNPFKLGGTLASPSLAVDSKRAALAFGKAAGGVLLFGPFGIAAALLDTKSGDENPCLTAIEAAKKGVEAPAQKKGTVSKAVDGAKEGIKGFGKKLKSLFGD